MSELNEELLHDAATYAGQWLAYQQRLKEIPAMTVAIRYRDTIILSAAYGYAHAEKQIPVTPDHIFRVASHSKWFTATAILQLKEQGELRLDDPVKRFVPWLREPLSTVTIRDLLNHAAGITRDGYDNDHWQLEHPFPDSTQLRRLVEEEAAVLPPNHKLKYSNIGYSLLGIVVEAAAGVPYNRYVQERIVNPLGLQNTGPDTTPDVRARMVTGYTSRALLEPRIPLPDVGTGAMSAATGFYSTALDLTRFAAAHFFGAGDLITDESKREMQRPYWPVEDMDSYGLGMQVAKLGERWVVGHSGGFPGHTTRTYLDPVDQFAVSVLTSESGGIATDLTKSVIKLLDLGLKQTADGNAGHIDRYTGRFTSLWGFTDITRLGDQLFMVDPSTTDPATLTSKLEVIDDDSLRIEEKEGYGSPGEYVRFTRDEDDQIVKVSVAGSTQYPLGSMDEYLRRRRKNLASGQ